MKLLTSTFLSLILIVSCKTNQTETNIQSIADCVSTPRSLLLEAVSTDPYFDESLEVVVPEGPQSITRNILQDRTGRYWMATWQGLIKYEDDQYINITNQEGLERHRFFSLLEDRDGNIWAGTIGAGLYKYDGDSYQHFTTHNGLLNNDIQSLYQSQDGRIWIGTLSGISVMDGDELVNYSEEDGIKGDINAFVEDDNGVIWIAARGHMHTYDGQLFKKVIRDGMPFSNVRTIIKTRDGDLWWGGNDGLWRYNGQDYEQLADRFVGYLYQDREGNIWSSESHMSALYDMSLYKYTFSALPLKDIKSEIIWEGPGQVFGIIEDTEGDIWFGTERGVEKVHQSYNN